MIFMCKPLLLVLLFVVLSIHPPNAQEQKEKDIFGWGKIDKTDLELKECDFDKNAEALVLFDVGELVSNDFSLSN